MLSDENYSFEFKSLRLISPIEILVSSLPRLDVFTLEFLMDVGKDNFIKSHSTILDLVDKNLKYLSGYAFVDNGTIKYYLPKDMILTVKKKKKSYYSFV